MTEDIRIKLIKTIPILIFIFCVPYVISGEILIGGETVYHVVKGDSIALISAKFGVESAVIIKNNNIDTAKPLQIGQEIRINNRRIVPKVIDDGIIINIPDKMLYFFKNKRLEMAFPVGIGMPSWRGLTIWRTPVGQFTVTDKIENPTWHVPKSMQWKMMIEGEPVKTVVPPGPDNPLGRYAIKISMPGIVLHETIWPASVYRFSSHGCIRILPENIEKFYKAIKKNTQGEIVYIPVKVAVSEKKVFLEVHRDIYGKMKNPEEEVKILLKKAGVENMVDWQKIERILREKSGVAEDITFEDNQIR